MTHSLYSVFKHPAPFNGKLWAVQMPKGIICFKTKKQALGVAADSKASDVVNN